MDIEKTSIWTNINLEDLLENPKIEEKRNVLFENFSNGDVFSITKDLAVIIDKLKSPDIICATEVKLAGFSRSTRIPLVCKHKEDVIVFKLVKDTNSIDKALVQLQRITDLIEEHLIVSEVYMAVVYLGDNIKEDSLNYLGTLIKKDKVCITTLGYFINKIRSARSIDFLTNTGTIYDSNNK